MVALIYKKALAVVLSVLSTAAVAFVGPSTISVAEATDFCEEVQETSEQAPKVVQHEAHHHPPRTFGLVRASRAHPSEPRYFAVPLYLLSHSLLL